MHTFIETFGNEIAVLIDVPVAEIRAVHPKVADAIAALRDGTVILHPGGGGKYGTFSLCKVPEPPLCTASPFFLQCVRGNCRFISCRNPYPFSGTVSSY